MPTANGWTTIALPPMSAVVDTTDAGQRRLPVRPPGGRLPTLDDLLPHVVPAATEAASGAGIMPPPAPPTRDVVKVSPQARKSLGVVGVLTQVHAFRGDTACPGEKLFTLRRLSEYVQNAQAELRQPPAVPSIRPASRATCVSFARLVRPRLAISRDRYDSMVLTLKNSRSVADLTTPGMPGVVVRREHHQARARLAANDVLDQSARRSTGHREVE